MVIVLHCVLKVCSKKSCHPMSEKNSHVEFLIFDH